MWNLLSELSPHFCKIGLESWENHCFVSGWKVSFPLLGSKSGSAEPGGWAGVQKSTSGPGHR